MKKTAVITIVFILLISCSTNQENFKRVVFLAHSTGRNVYNDGDVPGLIEKYNIDNGTDYEIELRYFPERRFYGWRNYPFDYWNIWVNHKGYKFEPSLKKLSRQYDMIIWKHCYPGSRIDEDSVQPSVNEEAKSLAAYKLQYDELKDAMHEYPDTDFLVWTLAVMREGSITVEQGERSKAFVDWVKYVWDEPNDNIHIWDFYSFSTTSAEGDDQSLYLRPEYASEDDHPNEEFNKNVAPDLASTVIEILSGRK